MLYRFTPDAAVKQTVVIAALIPSQFEGERIVSLEETDLDTNVFIQSEIGFNIGGGSTPVSISQSPFDVTIDETFYIRPPTDENVVNPLIAVYKSSVEAPSAGVNPKLKISDVEYDTIEIVADEPFDQMTEGSSSNFSQSG